MTLAVHSSLTEIRPISSIVWPRPVSHVSWLKEKVPTRAKHDLQKGVVQSREFEVNDPSRSQAVNSKGAKMVLRGGKSTEMTKALPRAQTLNRHIHRAFIHILRIIR